MKYYEIKMVNGEVFEIQGNDLRAIDGFLVIYDEFFEYKAVYNKTYVESCALKSSSILTNGE
jgi:hypothetical protein